MNKTNMTQRTLKQFWANDFAILERGEQGDVPDENNNREFLAIVAKHVSQLYCDVLKPKNVSIERFWNYSKVSITYIRASSGPTMC